MAVNWKSRNIKKYPFYIPKDCKDGRVEMYGQFISDFRLGRIGEYDRIGKMKEFLIGYVQKVINYIDGAEDPIEAAQMLMQSLK